MMHCVDCLHLQPWDVVKPEEGKMYHFAKDPCEVTYRCRACGSRQMYWLFAQADAAGGAVMKIGQNPPLAIEPPELVAKGMNGEDLRFYRQALILRNSGFGIAAVTYLRRIVENRLNFLLDLIAPRLLAEDPNSSLLSQLEQIKSDKRFKIKIDFAADLLPKSIRLGGHNPMSVLHGLTSEALHSLSDDEAIDVFDQCKLAFEHVIKRLKYDEEEEQEFKDALRKLNEKPKKDTPG